MQQRVHVPLNVLLEAEAFQSADMLSYRMPPFLDAPGSWVGNKAIAIAGRNPDVHTGMLDKQNGDWNALGMRFARQNLQPLAGEVQHHPGLIDVYRFCGDARDVPRGRPWLYEGLPWPIRRRIVGQMRRFAVDVNYGWRNVLRAGLYVTPLTRWAVPHHGAVDAYAARPFCSQAVSHCFRKFAEPLLNNRPDRLMLPGDIVTSTRLVRLFTIDPYAAHSRPIEWYFEQAAENN